MLNNEDFIDEEYEAEIITLEDDLGNEVDFEFLDVIEYNGDEYVVLLPEDEADEDQAEVVILRIESVDDETESYVGIDDEEVVAKVFELFVDKYKNQFDFD